VVGPPLAKELTVELNERTALEDLVDRIRLLRSLVESMAMGLTVDEMPDEEADLLNEILDSI
jgi:hypothetical protein